MGGHLRIGAGRRKHRQQAIGRTGLSTSAYVAGVIDKLERRQARAVQGDA
jgi:hypothetical protein